ncbi:P-loop containing nucleoside triphosphate hydrolase protein [Lipomyces japonicus]|uniref:P-loop containing nucleoside triphosphate hydrolase protein n=1 Tax=Lipomyces japonicus TaxID=56871 RepID=UPI0034CF615F
MLIVGLTGGIATGKSTVSAILAAPPYSFPVVDCDKIARDVVAPGTDGYRRIVAHFGPHIPDLVLPVANEYDNNTDTDDEVPVNANNGGYLNRAALGRYVFAREDERKVLNSITHPAVRREVFRQILHHWLITRAQVVILDVPLLFEAKFDLYCGVTVVVSCHPDLQRARLLARDGAGLTEKDADRRISAQMPIDEKIWLADQVIRNDGSLPELRVNVRQVVNQVRPSFWRYWLELVPPVGAFVALIVVIKRYLNNARRPKQT